MSGYRKKLQELLSELDSCREGSENEQGNQEHVNVLTLYISQMEGATPSLIIAWQACTFQESFISCADIIVSAPIYTVNVNISLFKIHSQGERFFSVYRGMNYTCK